MKQVSQNYKTGRIRIENVQSPLLKPGGILVRTAFSVISAGTEGMKVREGKLSYVGKARARPDQVKKVMQSVQQHGLAATYEKVMSRLDSLTPLGYSLAGVVVETSAGGGELIVGQRVACAGAGYANHAELNYVPRNLAVPVPEGVSLEHAAFATIGAIAMQGFRQAEMQLGETACVVGLGLLGQLLVQILRAAGMQVVGLDLVEERCRLAQELGAHVVTTPSDPGLRATVKQLTGGIGVDCTFICAGGGGNGPVEIAAELARDRARVVDIGKTRLDLPWNDYYEKELDVRFSRSYGPGRYDPNYEERGIDYPIGYVRWTERRNMAAFLRLVADGRVLIDPIVSAVFPLEDAEKVYAQIAEGKDAGLGIVFRHTHALEPSTAPPKYDVPLTRAPIVVKPARSTVGIGVIGAGNYASSMLLPPLQQSANVDLEAVATATSLSAVNAARRFGFRRTTTNHREILADNAIDAVLIATRHSDHAAMAAEALRTGKSVFVEKPLAIDLDGVELVRRAAQESGNARLLVGFNRRFSAPVMEIKRGLGASSPLTMLYRVHVGQLDGGSWYLDAISHGSRFAGEAGHFFDVFAYLTGCRPLTVTAKSLRSPEPVDDNFDNVTAIVEYEDGSLACLQYLTQGAASVPKEYLEVFGGSRTYQLFNFERLCSHEGTRSRTTKLRHRDKGQRNELDAFIRAVRSGEPMPIAFDSLLDTTLVTLAASDSIRNGSTIHLADYWKSEIDEPEASGIDVDLSAQAARVRAGDTDLSA